MRLLLVEDDLVLGDGVRAGLMESGYAVDWMSTGEEALAALHAEPYTVMVLDIRLPGINGLEVLNELRSMDKPIPVLLLTANDAISDKITGLDKGADDYLIKPFDFDELLARLRAIVRRYHDRSNTTIRHGNIELDPAAHTVTINGEIVDLKRREFALLLLFLENRGKVMSREFLEENLYSWEYEIGSNAIEVHIHHLRRKFGNYFIRTIRGVGYTIDKN